MLKRNLYALRFWYQCDTWQLKRTLIKIQFALKSAYKPFNHRWRITIEWAIEKGRITFVHRHCMSGLKLRIKSWTRMIKLNVFYDNFQKPKIKFDKKKLLQKIKPFSLIWAQVEANTLALVSWCLTWHRYRCLVSRSRTLDTNKSPLSGIMRWRIEV